MSTLRFLAVAAVVGLSSSCCIDIGNPFEPQCGPETCANGCCNAGQCTTGVENGACGSGGLACGVCTGGAICQQNQCVGGSGTGGGSGLGGGTGTGGGTGGTGGTGGAGGGTTGDCRTGMTCGSGTYCDVATGQCNPGCLYDSNCTGAGQVCEPVSRTCVCRAGSHSCNGGCFPDGDVAHCGSACSVCSTSVANAVAACVSGGCTFTCQAGFSKCGSRCSSDSDATACGTTCAVCPGGVSGGSATCSLGTCGIECQTGSFYVDASGTCNALTIAVGYSQSVPGPVGTWESSFDQYWVIPKGTGFEELDLDTSGTVFSSGTTHTSAFTALPSVISSAEAGTYYYPNYLAIVGTGVQYLHTWSTTSDRCTWMDPAVQNPTKVVMGGSYSGSTWAAVETAQGITAAELSSQSGSSNCLASGKRQVASAGAKLWAVDGDYVTTSMGSVVTQNYVGYSGYSSTSWTLPGAPAEVTPPFARVGTTVYVLPSSSGSAPKLLAKNVAFIGPRPLGSVNGNAGPMCMRYGDGLRCGTYDPNTDTFSSVSRVTTETTDFHSVIRSFSPTLFYRTPAGIKWTVLH